MNKIKLTGQILAAFSTLGEGILVYAMQFHSKPTQPNLKLKTQPKQLSGSFPLACALPILAHLITYSLIINLSIICIVIGKHSSLFCSNKKVL
jgi:hypothetical protein